MNKSLEELGTIYSGKDYKHNAKGERYPIYGTGGIMGHTSVSLNEGPAILTGRKGTINKPIYVEGGFWNVDTIFCVKPKSDIDPKWLYYNFSNIDLSKLNEATGVPSVSSKALYKLSFRWVDFNEQKRISKILDKISNVIQKTQAAIAKYQAIKQGMLHDLFTRGIDIKTGKLRPTYKEAPKLYKQSELGMIPKDWLIQPLAGTCSMKSGEGITSRSISEIDSFPVYGGNGLRGYTSTFTHEGDYVLIGRQGALCGNITRVAGKFYASEHAVVVTTDADTDVDWLSQLLDTMNLNQYSEASAQPGLSVSKILKLKIVVPDYEEQCLIAERLVQADNKLNTEQTYLQKLQQLKSGLMNDLLSGKKKVKLPAL